MTSPLSPEAVAQMVADLDLFSRCGDVGVMDRDMAIDAKAMLATLAAENATLRAERDEARTWLGAANNEFGSAAWDWPDLWRRISQLKELSNSRWQSLNAAQDELATLRASEAAAMERVRVLERECRLTQAQVDRMLVNSTKMDANITTLTEAAARVLHDIDDIVANSEGVAGLHMNGEVAEWHSLMSGGSFEAWLRSVEVLRAALTPTADKE